MNYLHFLHRQLQSSFDGQSYIQYKFTFNSKPTLWTRLVNCHLVLYPHHKVIDVDKLLLQDKGDPFMLDYENNMNT